MNVKPLVIGRKQKGVTLIAALIAAAVTAILASSLITFIANQSLVGSSRSEQMSRGVYTPSLVARRLANQEGDTPYANIVDIMQLPSQSSAPPSVLLQNQGDISATGYYRGAKPQPCLATGFSTGIRCHLVEFEVHMEGTNRGLIREGYLVPGS